MIHRMRIAVNVFKNEFFVYCEGNCQKCKELHELIELMGFEDSLGSSV